MNKLIILVICSAMTTICVAEKPSWYPDDLEASTIKCYQENQLPLNTPLRLNSKPVVESAKIFAMYLCKAKATNIYTEEFGINAGRLKYLVKQYINLNCDKPIVEDCVATFKEAAKGGELIYKVIECISEKELELSEKGC